MSKEKLSNPFFVDDRFFVDWDDYIEYITETMSDDEYWQEGAQDLAFTCNLEPLVDMKKDSIITLILDCMFDRLEDRFPEDFSDGMESSLKNAIDQAFDYEKFIELCPKLWYPHHGEKVIITAEAVNESLKEYYQV